VQAGQTVLIQGAGGGVGTFSVLIAKAFGAEVTAVCGTHNVEVIRSIGADHVIDYTQEDFTRNGTLYDLILAVNGYHPLRDYKRALSPHGMYLVAGGSLKQVFEAMALGPLASRNGQKLTFMGIASTPKADLLLLSEMLESGTIVPAIDRTYPLEETAAAMRYLRDGHAEGKVVITVTQGGD
jgi:NADPH:quinone reductase-like Zn-dependent oxidoreductase